MSENKYKKYIKWFHTHKTALRWFRFLSKVLPGMFVLAYGFLLFSLIIAIFLSYNQQQNSIDYFKYIGTLVKITIVPLVVVVSVTILRKVSDSKRPYEEFNFKPLLARKKHGESFPSRHIACASVISMVILSVSAVWVLGIVFFLLTLLLAAMRVISGMHYVRDVVVSLGIGIIAGLFIFL
ncbi:MAG: phosphatase PAP2 family protein [Oscillospiraceae bacterium]|nr:phosphatase PAP2 family protein [Oscillospiraceae bacterium]